MPLIDDLSNPAMRTRHWKQLVRVTGGAVQIDNDTLKRMTLGELLSLGLQSKLLSFIGKEMLHILIPTRKLPALATTNKLLL